MKQEKEEDLFNSSFRESIYYILKNLEFYAIVKFVNKNPISLKTEYSSKNLQEILEKGAELSKNNGLLFINDTIFS
jgi:hypothetical protein